MDDRELEALLVDLESDRVERKESLANKGRICEAVCAFANDLPDRGLPGVLFIGVRNNGDCANLPITEQLLLDLAGLKTDNEILPFPSLVVEKRVLNGCELAVVIVQPSEGPPIRYRGRTWIRGGHDAQWQH